jgi:hypothetical protein
MIPRGRNEIAPCRGKGNMKGIIVSVTVLLAGLPYNLFNDPAAS